ncbi:DUF111 family protein [Candidatus Micrarchaeota archaeon]|nr:DUF111 family protein [Candidatus Micrarchaeota archaeon]
MIEECMLETNLDDISGEILGYTAERLMSEGAKDVCFVPIIAKKGRPGFILQVICEKEYSKKLASIIMEETGTLGVRETIFKKHIAEREVREVGTKFGKVKVKISKTPNSPRIKPEYEDVRKIALKMKKPYREVYDEIMSNISKV